MLVHFLLWQAAKPSGDKCTPYFTFLLFYLFTFLRRMLACTHTSLNHIHHIVAKFLAL